MNILYLTDDRTDYGMGYYYIDWIKAFQANHHVILWGPGYKDPDPDFFAQVDLFIIGHGAFDIICDPEYGYFSRKQRLQRFLTRKPSFAYWPAFLDKLNCPKVFLSKNDYKRNDWKIALYKREKLDLIITHSKEAVDVFRQAGLRCEWIPFGVDRDAFKNEGQDRTIDIGFRGNLNGRWNNGLRPALVQAVQDICQDRALDVVSSQNAENFLFGQAYIDWMNRCHLMINTVSAIGTVGPKWWEQMACGIVPLAPIADYEGLLEPDVHYVAIKPDLSDLRGQVDRYFTDTAFQNQLIQNITQMAEEAGMDKRLASFETILETHKLI
ncbi:MAG: glycosyltransferase [Chloroflexota bacterium]